MSHKVSKVSDADDEYVYRGIRFEKTSVGKGYWGHYSTVSNLGKVRERAGTRKDLLAQIDAYLDRKINAPSLAAAMNV